MECRYFSCLKNAVTPFVLLLFVVVQVGVFGQNAVAQNASTGFPRIESDPKALAFFQLGQGRDYSWAELAEIGLWASGADNSRLEQINALAEAIRQSPDFPSSERGRAEFVLSFMHSHALKGYVFNQTRVDTMFENGRFNCVSSAVLYTILCKSVGIDVHGVMTKDHAFATVRIGGEDIDVETTNPIGFDPGSRTEFHDQFGKVTGFAYVPAQNYRDRQTINPIELISLILSNRIAELEKANRFADAVPLGVDRATLLSGTAKTAYQATSALFEDPAEYQLDRFINYGAFLLQGGKEEDALRWALLASERYPDGSRWQELIHAAANNRVSRLVKAGRTAEARNFLDAQKAILPSAIYAEIDSMLLDAELFALADSITDVAQGDKTVAAIDDARSSGRIDGNRAKELLTFAVQKTASVLSASPGRDWLAAINYIEKAVARFGANSELDRALEGYRGNRATDFHNRFANAWNKGNTEEAMQILDAGLAEFPSNRRLLQDKEMVQKNRS